MKKRILAIAAASMLLLAMLTACGSSNSTPETGTADDTAAADTVAADTAQAQDTAATADEGDLGEYHIKILDAETGLTDWEGNPAIGVRYEYTNNSAENMMFDVAVYAKAFQDGVQLESAIMDTSSAEYENSMKEVQSGTTIVCEEYYTITSQSEVQIEVTELISLDNTKLTKSFAVA